MDSLIAGQDYRTQKGHRLVITEVRDTVAQYREYVHKSSVNHAKHGMPTTRYFLSWALRHGSTGLEARLKNEGYRLHKQEKPD